AVRLVLATVVLYMAVNSLANIPARAQVRGELAALGLGTAGDIMIGPVPANPFRGTVVVATPEAYVLGRWDWFAEPRLTLHQPPIPRNLHHPLVAAAADDRQARRFLVWSRFPYGEVQATADGHQVRFRDARYASLRGGIAGPLVAVQGMRVAARAAPQGTAEIQMECAAPRHYNATQYIRGITHTMLSPAELARYGRHLTLPGFGIEAQERLKGARVLLIGAGGLGCPLGLYLAAAGVGVLAIVDGDLVEDSNLQRQVLFTTAD